MPRLGYSLDETVGKPEPMHSKLHNNETCKTYLITYVNGVKDEGGEALRSCACFRTNKTRHFCARCVDRVVGVVRCWRAVRTRYIIAEYSRKNGEGTVKSCEHRS